MAAPVIVLCSAGLFLRLLLINSPIADIFRESNEITTPMNSWKRVVEGLALHNHGLSAYDGDIFHETPLLLRFISCIGAIWPNHAMLFVVLDLIIAVILDKIAHHFARYMLTQQSQNVKSYSPKSASMLLRADDLHCLKFRLVAAYLFNPFTIANCLAKSTASFYNLSTALTILFTLKGSHAFACLALALSIYQNIYAIMLLVPLALHFTQIELKEHGLWHSITLGKMLKYFLMTAVFIIWYLGLSFVLEGSTDFMRKTYGFILTLPDLTPNIGSSWYFFTEMFEHFRTFFIWVIQVHIVLYTLPLGIKLRSHTMFLMYMLLLLIAVFKPYPCYGDLALCLALLPMWSHVLKYARNLFLIGCMFVSCTILAPVMYHVWIEAGSGNANFYFAAGLGFSTAQVFLFTDLLFAYLKHDFHLQKGPRPMISNDKVASVQLL